MKLQRAISREDFDKLAEELKVIFRDEKQKQRFSSFVTFMLRLLSTKLDKIDYEKDSIHHFGSIIRIFDKCAMR